MTTRTGARRPPILFHSQHLLGIGHARRAASLTRALAEAGENVLFVSGGLPVPGLELGGAEAVSLSPLTAGDEAASTLIRPDGRPPDAAYLDARRAQLLELLATRDPAVVLLELFPFGRHALAFELGPLLLALVDDRRRRGRRAPRVAVSLRDILVSKRNQPWYELSVLAVVRQCIDRVLVHGSPDVIPLSRTFGLAEGLGETVVYTGYLTTPPTQSPETPPHGEVVVSAGGGRAAGPFFRTVLAARSLSPVAAALPWRLLTGPYLPDAVRDELIALTRDLPSVAGRPAVVVESFRNDFAALLRGATLSVSQAGYNTVLDLVSTGVRAVVVPFDGSGDEQPLRARLLAERGLLSVVHADELTPARLAAAIDGALNTPKVAAERRIDLDGAARSVQLLAAMVDAVAAARQRPLRPGAGRPQSPRRR
ncbi:MAG: glycosyltransferase family protein [Candidatus Rokuibacteriota bacterium]